MRLGARVRATSLREGPCPTLMVDVRSYNQPAVAPVALACLDEDAVNIQNAAECRLYIDRIHLGEI